MALTDTQLDALTTNATLIGRVNQAVASHAEYWMNNSNATDTQKEWCKRMFVGLRCTQAAADLMRELVQDAAFTGSTTGDGSDVTDVALQGAVDKICEKYW